MKPIKIRIKDIEWQVELLSDLDYEDKHGKDSQGITNKDTKVVNLKKASFSVELIRHELVHVYLSSCCIDSCPTINAEDYEEVFAEIIAYHGEDICKYAKKLYNSLKAGANDE